MANKERLRPDFIFESSWEVCNKVGGIYTVLSTRANTLQELYKDQIVFIGPDLSLDNSDFIENKTLLRAWKKKAEEEGLKVRVGRWNVPGKPIAILVDFSPFYERKDSIYYEMWQKFGIDSTVGYGDYDDSCMFAYATGLVIESLYKYKKLEGKNVVAQLNEWMLGMAALYLKAQVPQIATIFTTHATSIGRSIAGNNKPLYDQFNNYFGDQMARELNMEGKHFLEKKAAHEVDCFTTVSELTAKECEQLLDKKPDLVLPNGFEADFVPSGKDFKTKRETARRALLKVGEALIGETLSEDSLLIAISGRYEYKNKGIDLFIESINKVRNSQPDKQIVAYILVPAWISGPRADLRARVEGAKKMETPLYSPYYTHELCNFDEDHVCRYLQYLNFVNQKEYNTKIIFVPSYLNGSDGIFNLPYYDLLIGMDLTVFPSYYEPWGYTPLESIAFHVPTITTNLAGFGLWAKEQKNNSGVMVVERTDYNYIEVAEEIKNIIIEYSNYSQEKIEETGRAAYLLSKKADWSHFINYYLEAYNIALSKKK